MPDKRIFKAQEIDSNKNGWVADMSGPDAINPDCYWYFRTKWQATKFVEMVGNGIEADEAAHKVEQISNAAAAMGSISSPATVKAARENAKKGGWPKGKKRNLATDIDTDTNI